MYIIFQKKCFIFDNLFLFVIESYLNAYLFIIWDPVNRGPTVIIIQPIQIQTWNYKLKDYLELSKMLITSISIAKVARRWKKRKIDDLSTYRCIPRVKHRLLPSFAKIQFTTVYSASKARRVSSTTLGTLWNSALSNTRKPVAPSLLHHYYRT